MAEIKAKEKKKNKFLTLFSQVENQLWTIRNKYFDPHFIEYTARVLPFKNFHKKQQKNNILYDCQCIVVGDCYFWSEISIQYQSNEGNLMSEGKLYLIPTPIGNLKDITLNALERLKEVDCILAEDTRKTGVLLKHFEISTKMQSYHMHNEHKIVKSLVKRLEEGQDLGLVTDAGTPGISDPGFLLVREAIQAGVRVECMPGATAFVPALVQSGLPCDKFIFEGFLPAKKGRKTKWEEIEKADKTTVLYESPHRLMKTLKEIELYMGDERKVAVCKEISKVYETTWRGTATELLESIEESKIKGEFVIVIGAKE